MKIEQRSLADIRPYGKNAKKHPDEQVQRSRWRTLVLMFKAKLSAVDLGLVKFDQEFLAHIGTPDGRTAGEAMMPVIERALTSGQMPRMLEA